MKKHTLELEQDKISTLLLHYALPSAISGLIGAAYNIIDQIFIGHQVGMIGNAATNVVFPIVTLTNAIGLMTGVGSSAGFSIALGQKEPEQAAKMIGQGLSLMITAGLLITLIVQLFLKPLMIFSGASASTLPLAATYEHIVGFGIVFFILSVGGSAIIRADGNPGFALFSVIIGAILNIFLDAFFMNILGWGITGAALATLISQIISGLFIIYYFLFRVQSIKMKTEHLIPTQKGYLTILKLGTGPFFNHVSMVLVQLMLNNALKTWGAASLYGTDIPLACAGIVTKVNSITNSIVVGIAQGAQPIISYNYGAKNYKRVRETGIIAIGSVLAFSFLVFLCFQLLPRQITTLFGTPSEELLNFTADYFRIFMMLVCVSGLQITVGNFFTSLKKPALSTLISASRQILAFPILLLIFPRIWGLDGVLYCGPVADGICAAVAMVLFIREYRRLL